MRLRLLRRRLTISAPRVAVRNALPWPFRWVVMALVLGFCAAIGLWAFEFGKSIAGLDSRGQEELVALRAEVNTLRSERDKAQSIANVSESLLTAERAAQEKLVGQVRTLETDNRSLRDDLGFFEKLIPAGTSESVAIRGLQVERVSDVQVRWQVLVIQPVKNAPEFNGKLELAFAGTSKDKPWTLSLPDGGQPLKFKQYRRIEGLLDVPPGTVVKNVTARLVEGTAVRAVQTTKL